MRLLPGPHPPHRLTRVVGTAWSPPAQIIARNNLVFWTSFKGLRFHLDLHFMGELSGQVLLDWLKQQGYGVCSVCNRVLSSHFNGLHPRCYRAFTAAALSVVLSSMGHLVCPMSPPPTAGSRPRSLRAPETFGVSASSMHSRQWLLGRTLLGRPPHHACFDTRWTLTRRSSTTPPPAFHHCLPPLSGLAGRLARRALGAVQPTCLSPSARPWLRLPSPTHISNRVASLIQDGALRRARAALTQEPPVQATSSVIDELGVLHPRPRPADSSLLSGLRDIGPAAVPCVSPDMIRKAVSNFSPASGAPASGLRPSHLQEAMRLASGDHLLSLLAEVVQLLLQGRVTLTVVPWLCGASLMALRKPSGALRPFALGETLRRVTSKIALELMGSKIQNVLEPNQIGVGTSFNCVDRSAVLQAVQESFPEIAPRADICYRSPSSLVIGDSTIDSTRGVQQGDPLGPAFLSLAIHPVTLKARSLPTSAIPDSVYLSSFFFDVGVLAGDAPAISSFLRHLITGFASIGLKITPDKTEVLPACSSSQSFCPEDFPGCTDFKLLGRHRRPPVV